MNRYAYADVISYRCRFPVLAKHSPHNSHFMQLTKTLKVWVQKGEVMIG